MKEIIILGLKTGDVHIHTLPGDMDEHDAYEWLNGAGYSISNIEWMMTGKIKIYDHRKKNRKS